jgi:hypothetical protein
LPKWTDIWWEAPMEGSVLNFLKAEWKVSDTGSAHWASSYLSMYVCISYILFFTILIHLQCKKNILNGWLRSDQTVNQPSFSQHFLILCHLYFIPNTCTYFAYCRDFRPVARCEYMTQIQLRWVVLISKR